MARGDTALPKNRGTGFEDGYADPPVTPSQHAEEMQLYDQFRPFHERIEECIQRYTARRRMPQDRSQLFSKYLYLGGIDTTQRQFTGTAKHVKDLKENDYSTDEIRGITANEFLSRDSEAKGLFYSPNAPEHWDVDFAGVVAGFLGSYLPENTYPDSPEIRTAADTILNFLNYVRHHDVCPEYTDNVTQAMEICSQALKELPQISAVGRALPGDFNLACRLLFCSSGVPLATNEFMPDHKLYKDKKKHELIDGEMVKAPGAASACIAVPSNFDAELVFNTTMALHEPEHIERINNSANLLRVNNTFDETYEVKEVVFADQSLVDVYAGITKRDTTLRPVEPVGHAILVPTIIEDGWDSHPTLSEGRAANPGTPISVYLDHTVLAPLGVGMKLRATVCYLDLGGGVGLEFIKEVAEIVPSFHVFLPQTLMLHYKAPRPDTRLPPSADDPDVEERRLAAITADEERADIKAMRKLDPELDHEMRAVEDGEALQKLMARSKI
ncbi:unnamed protein product [Discula destructiva]